jgi:hypothetical protein
MYRHLNLIVVIIFFILSVSRVHCPVLLNGQTLAGRCKPFLLLTRQSQGAVSPAEQKEDGQHLFTQAIQKIAKPLLQHTGTPCSGVLSHSTDYRDRCAEHRRKLAHNTISIARMQSGNSHAASLRQQFSVPLAAWVIICQRSNRLFISHIWNLRGLGSLQQIGWR